MATVGRQQEKSYCLGCLNESDFEDILHLGCSHSCCKSCVLAAAMQVLESETLERLKCPLDPNCDIEYPISGVLLEGLLNEEDLQKFTRIRKDASSNPPCPKCQKGAEAEKDTFYGSCSNCDYVFCTKCRTDYHGFSCKVYVDVDNLLRPMGDLFGSDREDADRKTENVEENGNIQKKETKKTLIPSCLVCLENVHPSLLVKFDCGHSSSCKPCVKAYFETMIREGNVHELKCPQPDCGRKASQKLVQKSVEPTLFRKYDQLLLNNALSNIPEIVNCPKPTCQRRVVPDPEYGYCEHCDFRFCTQCSQPYHGVIGCGRANQERRERNKRSAAADQKECDRLERELGLRKKQNIDSEKLIESIYKKCPSCNANIEKIEGCNHMRCTKCDSHFCWLCGVKISATNPHDHFNPAGSKCSLFYVPPEK